MDPETLITRQLSEAHALETALATNLKAHIALTTDSAYERVLRRHLNETQAQAKAIGDRLGELGANRSLLASVVSGGLTLARDAVGQVLVLTKGPLDVVRTPNQRERMLKNAKDECATEALEIATYDALEATARAAGDDATAKLAARHREQEERMLDDLRETITRLSARAYEDLTGERPRPAPKGRKRAAATA